MNKTCDTKPIFFTMIEDRFVYSVQKMFYLLFYHTYFPSLRVDFIASIFFLNFFSHQIFRLLNKTSSSITYAVVTSYIPYVALTLSSVLFVATVQPHPLFLMLLEYVQPHPIGIPFVASVHLILYSL